MQNSLKLSHLRFPLPQDRIWCPSPRQGCAPSFPILRSLRIATCVEDPVTNFHRILPDELLDVLRPRGFELFLADRARGVAKSWIIRHGNIGFLLLLALSGTVFHWTFAVFVLARPDPILCVLIQKWENRSHILTLSSTYQLRLWPRLAASAIRVVVLKCKSRCFSFLFLPSSVGGKRRPHVLHRSGRAS